MDDFGEFMLAQAKKREAFERYNYAGAALTNAQIMERLAEFKSQCEPSDSLILQQMTPRERMYAAAYWVVVGRMPAKESDNA